MVDVPIWLPPLVVALVGGVIVLMLTLRARNLSGAAARSTGVRGATIETKCTNCNKTMVINCSELKALSPTELALSVRAKPDLKGRKLATYLCPYCESSHYFTIDSRLPEWVGADLYTPQSKGSRCMDCGKPLSVAPWSPGAYDGRLKDAPQLLPDYGLVCSRCQAVVCVECTNKATRNRTKDGSLVCPRCHRTPVDRTYHPA